MTGPAYPGTCLWQQDANFPGLSLRQGPLTRATSGIKVPKGPVTRCGHLAVDPGKKTLGGWVETSRCSPTGEKQ